MYGWSSQFSFPYITIAASGEPFDMTALTTEYDSSQLTRIKLSWAAANDNSEPVDAYEILILQEDGTFSESSECDGSADPVLS